MKKILTMLMLSLSLNAFDIDSNSGKEILCKPADWDNPLKFILFEDHILDEYGNYFKKTSSVDKNGGKFITFTRGIIGMVINDEQEYKGNIINIFRILYFKNGEIDKVLHGGCWVK